MVRSQHSRSEEVHAWYTAVYEAVCEIPRGKVTSYGHIARLIGKPERSRQVGICLKHLPSAPSSNTSTTTPTFHSRNVPWQRVVNSRGQISPRGPGAAARQATALRREGVDVRENAMGEFHIDLSRWGWFPDVLPSEAGLSEDESSDEEEGEDGDESPSEGVEREEEDDDEAQEEEEGT